MKKIINQVADMLKKKRSVIVYLFVGAFTNILDVALYALLFYLGVHYLIASTISMFISLLSNFLLHRRFTFNSVGQMQYQAGRFLMSITFNYIITQAILYTSVSIFGMDEIFAKVLSLIIVVSYNYFLLKKWVFKN